MPEFANARQPHPEHAASGSDGAPVPDRALHALHAALDAGGALDPYADAWNALPILRASDLGVDIRSSWAGYRRRPMCEVPCEVWKPRR
jgi:hypothetical protein